MNSKKIILKTVAAQLYRIEKDRRDGTITENEAYIKSEEVLKLLPKLTFDDIIMIDDQVLTLLEKNK